MSLDVRTDLTDTTVISIFEHESSRILQRKHPDFCTNRDRLYMHLNAISLSRSWFWLRKGNINRLILILAVCEAARNSPIRNAYGISGAL